MASQGIEKAPGVLDVSVCLQHGAVLDQMEPLPRADAWLALNPDNREELNRGLEMLRKVGGTQLSYIH